MNRHTLTFGGLAALGLLSFSLVQAQDVEPIKIGIAVAQTSNASLFGQEQMIGARLAETYFNAHGGVNGRPIELVFEDTGGDEASAINAFQTIIAEDVVGIIGPTLSQQAFAADPLAETAGVPVIAPSNLAKGIPEIGPYINRISASAAVVAPNAVRAAVEINPEIKDVAVFYAQNDAFSSSETETFQNAVKELGLNLVTVQTFQTTDSDFSAQVTNATALNPQLVIISGLAVDGGNLVRQLREFGYTGLIVGGNGLSSVNMFPVCQALCEGIILAQAYSYSNDNAINAEYRELYKADQGGKEPPQFSAQAFSGVQVYVEALTEVDNIIPLETLDLATQRKLVNMALLSGGYDTPLGAISFTPEGDIVQERFYISQIDMSDDGTSGEFVFLK
jgi:branched-chain amino acid transport system substrate-binding protein